MAKRFTDTAKWDKSWFRKLTPEMKCVWIFLCDRCDHAGILDIDEESFKYYIGKDFNFEEILSVFKEKVQKISADKLYISGFIEFQYGRLNDKNKVHLSVINRLSRFKIKPLTSPLQAPIQGAKDKDKDKEKEKDKDKEERLSFDFESVYKKYPRKEGKAKGFLILTKTIKTENQFNDLQKAVENYAKHCNKSITEQRFIKQFSSFIGTIETPNWTDWINPVSYSNERQKGYVAEL